MHDNKDIPAFNYSELYRQSIERMPVHIYWKDKHFKYLSCNLLQANDAGFNSVDEIIGKSDYDLFDHSTADLIRKNDIEVITTGKACIFEEPWFAHTNRVHFFLTQKSPLLNDNGEIVGVIGISFNITERKKNEEKIISEKKEVERTLASIIDNLPGHVYWKNKDSVYQGCNLSQAKSAGFTSQSQIIGKTDYEMPWCKEAHILRESDLVVMRNRETLTREEASKLANSDQVSIFLSKKTPLYGESGEVIGILGISFDITDRKKMEEELRIAKESAEAASRAKTEFIANMGHDIRTPLTGIIGMSYILEDEVQGKDEKEHVNIIHQSGEQLLGLLNGVLDLITVDATNEDMVLHESFDVRRVIRDVMELERSAVESKHLSIKTHVDAAIPPYVVGDKMKLHRIILNLAGNAIKFTKVGHIEINAKLQSIEDNKAKILFSVKDTGIGIPDELQDKVFDRFFKVSPSYKGLYTGNGIGLHIAQKYVDLMGGDIRLASAVGVGTTFSFMLPMKIGNAPLEEIDTSVADASLTSASTPVKAKPFAKVEPTKSQSINPHQPQVLLVEDNVTALNVLKFMIKKFDVQVSTAVDAEIALDLVKKQHFDLIITDLGLPQKSGDEMTAAIRSYEQNNGLKPMTIVGLTGHALGDITQTCLHSGMNDVYRKPMLPETLKKLIDNLLLAKNEKSVEKPKAGGLLGMDLPDTEAQLFAIDAYPLLDIEVGIQVTGSEDILHDIYKNLKKVGITADLEIIQKAHESGDWKTVEKYTHKMKGGACYGTVRLYYALLYMERYLKAGHSHRSEELYSQMLRVIDETMAYLDVWLKT